MQANCAVILLLATLATAACDGTLATPPAAPTPAPGFGAVQFWESGASTYWNGIGQALGTKYHAGVAYRSARAMALLSVAQHRAVQAARGTTGSPRPSEQAAVAGASAAVLAYLYPTESQYLAGEVRSQEAGAHWPGEKHTSFALGESIGRDAAQAVIAHGQADGSGAVWTGMVPTGAGYWIPSPPPAVPAAPLWGSVTPWVMASGSQLRPPPPPAFGSDAFLSALAEVRQLSDTRTAEQLAIAQFWMANAVTYWNAEAVDLARRYHLNEARSAEALARMNVAIMDASIACWDAKYTYWFIRPWQADAAITTPVGRPNHPSYPSAHSCLSGGAVGVLAALFPAERRQLEAQLDEVRLARMYAGIHYRFDVDVGTELGRRVADLALAWREDR